MKRIAVYLTFDGNCREAMAFYRDCLEGELKVMTVGESPAAGRMPPEAQGKVMHAMLTSGEVAMMASDMLGPAGLTRGNGASLMIECSSEEEVKTLLARLSAGGRAAQAPKVEFWGAMYADLTDKFGVRWMLSFEKPRA
jgi:PhnB protein